MKMKLIVTGVLSTFMVFAFVIAFGAGVFPASVSAHGAWHGQGKHDPATHAKHCERLQNGKHLKFLQAGASAMLDLDDTQQGALEPMIATLDAWRGDAASICLAFDGSTPQTVVASAERLARRTADALAELQPQLDQFYGQLSDAQKQELTELLKRHHRHHGRH